MNKNDLPTGAASRARAILIPLPQSRRQRRPAGAALFESRRRPFVDRRADGLDSLAGPGAGALFRDDPGQRLAVGTAPSCAAHRLPVPRPDVIISGRDILQQFSAEQHRRRRDPHHRYGAGRRIQDPRDDGRADRSRHRPARPGAGGGDGSLGGPRTGQGWPGRPRDAVGRLRRGRDDRDPGAAHARRLHTYPSAAPSASSGMGRRAARTADGGAVAVQGIAGGSGVVLRRSDWRPGHSSSGSTWPSPTACGSPSGSPSSRSSSRSPSSSRWSQCR